MADAPVLQTSVRGVAMWLAGNKSVWGWRLSLLNQGVWGTWIVATHTWGFLPMTLAMVFVSTRNMIAWGRKGPTE